MRNISGGVIFQYVRHKSHYSKKGTDFFTNKHFSVKRQLKNKSVPFFMTDLITEIASDEIIDAAYAWLCSRRENHSHNNDVWNLRIHWERKKPEIQRLLLADAYQFSPQTEFRLPDGDLQCWSAGDSLVLKAITIVLGKHLAPVLSPACTHVAGHGGAKKAVREVFENLSNNDFVMKSDVKSYYASIDHKLLRDILAEYVDDDAVLHLGWQYLNRTVTFGENYREVYDGAFPWAVRCRRSWRPFS